MTWLGSLGVNRSSRSQVQSRNSSRSASRFYESSGRRVCCDAIRDISKAGERLGPDQVLGWIHRIDFCELRLLWLESHRLSSTYCFFRRASNPDLTISAIIRVTNGREQPIISDSS